MKIATLNIDWGKTYNSKIHFKKIEKELNSSDFDIIIITEGVDLDLPAYDFVYKTNQLPQNEEYEGLNYNKYLNGTSAYRVIIYSKFPCIRTFRVSDKYTSLCKQFETDIGIITIYGTIIGTWYKKEPYASKELNNCVKDCLLISHNTDTLCVVGDLNTSFLKNEVHLKINDSTTKLLSDLFKICKLDLTTKFITQNIDHIFLPKKLKKKISGDPKVFINKNVLSDHQGVYVELNN